MPPRMAAYSEASKAVFAVFARHHAAGRGPLDRRGVPRRRRAAQDRRDARRDRRPSCGRGCATRSGCRSPSASPARSSWPRWPAAWPSPTACCSCRPTASCEFLHPLPVERLWGVGPGHRGQAARARRHARSAEVARARRGGRWSRSLGRAAGRHLNALAHDRDPRPVAAGRRRRSIGSQQALGRRSRSDAELDADPRRARRPASTGGCATADRAARTVVLRLRFDDFSRATRSHSLAEADRAHRHRSWQAARVLLRGALPMIARARHHAARRLRRRPRRRRRAAARAPVRRARADRPSTARSMRCSSDSAADRSPGDPIAPASSPRNPPIGRLGMSKKLGKSAR